EEAGETDAEVEQGLVVRAPRQEWIGQLNLGVGAHAAAPERDAEADGSIRQAVQQRERSPVAGDVGPAERKGGMSGSEIPELGSDGMDGGEGERDSPECPHGVILPPTFGSGADRARGLGNGHWGWGFANGGSAGGPSN